MSLQNTSRSPGLVKSLAHHTPEFRLGRSDSKDPFSTCRGLTTNGRPCRRSVATKNTIKNASAYCWQHQDQELVPPVKQGFSPLQGRSSIDSLISRLGVSHIGPGQVNRLSTTQPRKTNDIADRQYTKHKTFRIPQQEFARPKPAARKHGFWSSLCCMHAEDDYQDHETTLTRPYDAQPTYPSTIPVPCMTQSKIVPPVIPYHNRPAQVRGPSTRQPLSALLNQANAVLHPATSSQAAELDTWIPDTLPSVTRTALQTELAKPPSLYDGAGYIYIFWLTDGAAPPTEAAKTLLPTTPTRPQPRRADELMRTYSTSRKTIMLKIGRANNVHRRMNEWARQCGHNVSLVRWYPYTSSTESVDPTSIKKVKHAHRVERLIHVELASRRIKRDCDECGREHREWFEIEATARGVAQVDSVVKKWVAWAESVA